MNGMASLFELASRAAQPLPAGATCVDLPHTSDPAGARPPGGLSGDHATALLGRITHGSADQSLTLLGGMSVTARADRR